MGASPVPDTAGRRKATACQRLAHADSDAQHDHFKKRWTFRAWKVHAPPPARKPGGGRI